MKREAFFLLGVGVFVYLSFALYMGDDAPVGIFGNKLADILKRLFGNLIYFAPPAGFWAIYRAYKYPPAPRRWLEVIAAILLFGAAGAIFEAMLFQASMIGNALYETMHPYIGKSGILIFAFFLIVNGWLLSFRVTVLGVLRFLAGSFPNSKLFARWKVFKEATRDSFENLLTNGRDLQELDDIPPFEPRGVTTQEIDEYLRGKRREMEEFSEQIELDPSDKRRIAVLEGSIREDIRKATVVRELEENKKLLELVEKGKTEKPKDFKLPALEFLAIAPTRKSEINEADIDAKIADLLEKLRMFKIDGDVVRTYTGPVVTTFEFKPSAHVKVSRILSLESDIAMALRAQTIRIQAPIPGKDVVGIEIPNQTIETIYLHELLSSRLFLEAASELTIVLGKDIVGNPFITDLKKLPHLLIAGTTGSGKSVGINAMILSLLYRNSPDTLRLLMIDPKMLEFSVYNDIPHLLTPVITKPKQAIAALANMVLEMERRYAMMSKTKTKNIESYNQKAVAEKFDPMPFIVVVIDELADLIMTGGKEVEISIARLAQMARASGIHLIVATQRPSVDVITGLIKANLPSRISYRVGSKIDSKVILDTQGAESLLGRGDMLFTPPSSVGLVRLHAPFSTEKEIEKVTEFLKAQRPPEYDNSFLAEGGDLSSASEEIDPNEPLDDMFEEAKAIVLSERKSSISYIQRRLQIGYNRAARIIEQLEKHGVLGEQNSKGQREIL